MTEKMETIACDLGFTTSHAAFGPVEGRGNRRRASLAGFDVTGGLPAARDPRKSPP